MTGSPAIATRRATDADRPAVLELLGASLGWDLDSGLADFFRWKHEQNPFGASPAWVALDGDRIVGFRTLLRWEFDDAEGRVHRAVRAVDTATHPEYQGRGIFRLLTLAAIDALTADGVEFVFNTPNDKSRPGYLSMGWQEMGRPSTSVRVRSPRSLIRLIASRVPAERWPAPGAPGLPAAEVLTDERVDQLLGRLAPPGGFRTRRTKLYLRWRYGFGPLGYRAIAAGGDPAQGIVVFRLRRRGRATEAALCDLLVPDGAKATARSLARSVAKSSGADYVIKVGRASTRSGFFPLPGQGPIVTWRALSTTEEKPPAIDRWELALGDVELL